MGSTHRRLMLNQEALGNTVDQALYFDEYRMVIENLSQLPKIYPPESLPV